MTREASQHLHTTTLQAMLQQEDVYYNSNNTNNSNQAMTQGFTASKFNHLVSGLETLQDLLQLKHRETLVIATNYLSRYLLHNTSSSFNVSHIALTCLYMACKIHEPAALPLRTLTDLHQRVFADGTTAANNNSSSWEQLELEVCSALKWRLHPPTPLAFCQVYLRQEELPRRLRRKAQACLESAFRSDPCTFARERASALAMAALTIVLPQEDVSAVTTSSSLPVTTNERALAFLREHYRPSTTPSATSSKKNRKRCVTPPPHSSPSSEVVPRNPKRLKTHHHATTSSSLSPCLISTRPSCFLQQQQSIPAPCLLWIASPRSALSMAE